MTQEYRFSCCNILQSRKEGKIGTCTKCKKQFSNPDDLFLLDAYSELRLACIDLETAISCKNDLSEDELNRLEKGVVMMKVGFKFVKGVLRKRGYKGNLKKKMS